MTPGVPAGAGEPRRPGARSRAWRLAGRLDPVLVAIVVAGGALRFWGLGHGLPHVYNPDESSILLRALSLGSGTLNPHNFLYPSLYLYVLAGTAGALFLVERALGLSPSLAAFEAAFLVDPTPLYVISRSLSAIAGTATIAATYLLAHRLADRATARVAAACLAFAYIPVRDAHFVKHDVPVTFLLVLVVLACWRAWRNGRLRDSVTAGALAGAAMAFHYYAIFALVPLVVAHALGRRIREVVTSGRLLAAGAAALLAFACLSPYVLIDLGTALRDVAANRQIVVGRAIATYGYFGAGLEHVRLMATQGAGVLMLVCAAAGVVLHTRRDPRTAAWAWSFPVTYFLFISNAWPFGRLENPLYPFVSVAAAMAVRQATRAWNWRGAAAMATVVVVAQPAVLTMMMNRLLTTTDTRTLAAEWIAREIPAGATVALQPYSVPLVTSREGLREAVEARVGSVSNASRRFRAQLALDPYPAPAYRLLFLGDGLDQDKRYLGTADRTPSELASALRAACVTAVALKRFSFGERDDLGDELDRAGRRVWSVSPFDDRRAGPGTPAQMPDYDVRPSLATRRPGPMIDVWLLPPESPCSAP